jgi:outer membrane protein assembly factor BamB
MSRRRFPLRLIAIGVAVVGVLIAAAVAVFVLTSKQGNVLNPTVPFTVPTTPTTPTTPKKPKKHVVDNFVWPRYGYDLQRTRYFTAANPNLKPPLRRTWSLGGNGPLEFPPVIHAHELFYMDDDTDVKAVNTLTGKVVWSHTIGKLSAASPALDVKLRMLYVPTLSDTSTAAGAGDGRFAALSMKTGKIVWSRPLPSGAESSPLVVNGDVLFGDSSGTVYALKAKTGQEVWSFQAGGAVKGGLAYSDGDVYFDDYASNVYALNAKTGHEIWNENTGGGAFGFESGTFYTTPAIAFGRVYVGNTNGFMYSFDAKNGELAWRISTGAYVYSSAAVGDIPKLGPTVFFGSYNGEFYALNAQTGATRWEHENSGDTAISGSPTIVNNVVYYSGLDQDLTTGLDTVTGKQVFSYDQGAFSPIVAEPGALFLVGHYVLYKFVPQAPAKPNKKSTSKHSTSKKKH